MDGEELASGIKKVEKYVLAFNLVLEDPLKTNIM